MERINRAIDQARNEEASLIAREIRLETGQEKNDINKRLILTKDQLIKLYKVQSLLLTQGRSY